MLTGGAAVGACYQATLVMDVPGNSELANTETFGPVATIEIVDNEDEAVARANDTSYGLSSGIITSDPDRGMALANRIEAGIVHVNDLCTARGVEMRRKLIRQHRQVVRSGSGEDET